MLDKTRFWHVDIVAEWSFATNATTVRRQI
jgi:hypothetical protein